MYKKYIRPILFKFDPENIHNLIIYLGRFMSFTKLSRLLRTSFVFKNDKLENEVMGIKFENPIGLSAGFDKNAFLTDFIPDLGFGFIEIGSVTANSCEGNPKPRLHRLVKDSAIIVHYGLANQGAEKIYQRLKDKQFRIPLGVSIAKTNDPSIKGNESVEDYFKSFQIFRKLGDYITINISCPNSGDGRSFEDPILLESLLKKIEKVRKNERIVLKISPDISERNLNSVIALSKKYNINGFIISNLSKKRENLSKDENLKYDGGISGKPIRYKSDELIKKVYRKTKGKFVIIGSGGVFSGKDAYRKIKNGASLVQLITGMIYEGPGIVKKINQELVELLEKDEYKSI
ncbi:MAG: quinone-dependent dihydroorotate dehydrogenase, partial [Nanoarchaeota archaeon]